MSKLICCILIANLNFNLAHADELSDFHYNTCTQDKSICTTIDAKKAYVFDLENYELLDVVLTLKNSKSATKSKTYKIDKANFNLLTNDLLTQSPKEMMFLLNTSKIIEL